MNKRLLNVLLASSLCVASLTALAEEYNLNFSVYKSYGGQPELFNQVDTLIEASDNANPIVSSLDLTGDGLKNFYNLESSLRKEQENTYSYSFNFKSEKAKVIPLRIEKIELSQKVSLKPNEITTIEKEPYTVKIKLSPLTK